MTFRELQDLCLRELGYDPASLSTEPRERVKDRLNHWHRRLLTRPVLSRLLREASRVTFACTSGTAQYSLPSSVEQVVGMRDETNDRYLPCVSLNEVRSADPGLTSTGVPEVWVLLGQRSVSAQPATADSLWVKSTSDSDTMSATVEYLTSSTSTPTKVTVTMTGTTAVQVGSASTAYEVTRFDVSSPCVGTVTLHQTSGAGTQLGSILPGTTHTQWWWVQLYPTPTSTITYNLDVVRRLTDLTRDYEEPLIPRDFQDVLSLGALADEWRRKGDLERSTLLRQDYDQRLKDLEWWVWNLPAYQAGEGTLQMPSRLGPWTPAGS